MFAEALVAPFIKLRCRRSYSQCCWPWLVGMFLCSEWFYKIVGYCNHKNPKIVSNKNLCTKQSWFSATFTVQLRYFHLKRVLWHPKVEEPIPIKVIIRTIEIILYLIFQSPKRVSWAFKTDLSFRQVWIPVVDDKHWTCGNYRFSCVHMKMASLLSQPTKLNRSLQLLILNFVEYSLCSLKNIPSGFDVYTELCQ
jgi:hypothetical protein